MKSKSLHSSIRTYRTASENRSNTNLQPRQSISRHRRPSMFPFLTSRSQSRPEIQPPTDFLLNAPENSASLDVGPQNFERSSQDHNEESLDTHVIVTPTQLTAFKRSLRSVLAWNRLFALLCVSGKIRFSAAQYKILAAAIKTASNNDTTLHTYKTIRTTQWEFLLNNLFPKSTIIFITNNHTRQHRSETTTKLRTNSNGMQDARDCVRLILPSEWAKLDVITQPIYEEIFNDSPTSNSRKGFAIETSPLVQAKDRSVYTGGRVTLWADYLGTLLPSEINDNINLTVQGVKPMPHNKDEFYKWFPISVDENKPISLRGRVGPSWCVTPRDVHSNNANSAQLQLCSTEERHIQSLFSIATHKLVDFDRIFNTPRRTGTSGSQQQQSLRGGRRGKTPTSSHQQHARRAPQAYDIVDYENIFLFPGDSVVIIRPPDGLDTCLFCLYIGSFIWREDGRVAERIFWIRKEDLLVSYNTFQAGQRTIVDTLLSLDIQFWGISTATPKFSPNFVPSAAAMNFKTRNKGVLDDGTPYVIYRFLLYSDGFKQKKSLSDKRSVCGFYILPLGLSHKSKLSSNAARILTLSSHGQDTNEVFNHIIDDVVLGATEGFDSVDAKGKRTKIFLDAAAKVGDFPAVSESTDVSGHMSDAHCSFCSVRKRKGGSLPPILFTTALHSRRFSLTRFDERMRAIRAENPSHTIRQHLGTSCETEEDALKLFSVRMAAAFQQARHKTRKSNTGEFILNNYFDSYLSAAACPDHLFKGLIENVLTLCFDTLSSDHERRLADASICQCVQHNGLPSIDTVLNWDKHGKYGGLNKLTTTGLFCVAVFAGHIFSNLAKVHEWPNQSGYRLPQQLQDIISLVFWAPFTDADTMSQSVYVSGSATDPPLQYHSDIHNLICKYIASVKSYYSSGGRQKEHLDKPNAHRLIELSVHTIPIFKHALNVSELVLEMAHRISKEWLEHNTSSDSQITAVELAQARDWSTRLLSLYTIWNNATSDEKAAAEIGLRRLLLGQDSVRLNEDVPGNAEFKTVMEELREKLPKAFREPVPEQLQGTSRHHLLPTEHSFWDLSSRRHNEHLTAEQVNGGRLLDQHYKEGSCSQSWEPIAIYAAASLMRSDRYSPPRACGSADGAIGVDNFVSVLLVQDAGGTFLATASTDIGVQRIFQVKGFYLLATGEKWALLHSLRETDERNVFQLLSNPTQHMVRLSTAMRRVAAAHVCDKQCEVRFHGMSGRLHHNPANRLFRIFNSRDGFPPHMG